MHTIMHALQGKEGKGGSQIPKGPNIYVPVFIKKKKKNFQPQTELSRPIKLFKPLFQVFGSPTGLDKIWAPISNFQLMYAKTESY